MHPKVFVSHASEDKERFVINFATKLRENGIDAWVDKWEILPGDSLVDKIFGEGIKEAQAVIIVLSNHSVDKPWVCEELNASFIKKISEGTKIIPVVLDNCKVPEVLVSTVWEKIESLNSYEDSFQRILSSITGVNTDKPPLGSLPSYSEAAYSKIEGLTKADNLILKESCEYAIKKNITLINPEGLFGDGSHIGLNRAEIKDCIEILGNTGYFHISEDLGPSEKYNCNYKITPFGFHSFAMSYLKDYQSIIEAVISAIVNEKLKANNELQKKLNQPIVIINYILDLLEQEQHIKLSKTIGGGVSILHVSPALRRFLSGGD